MPLSDTAVRQLKPESKNYKRADGQNLYLLVRTSGTKSWQMKYRYLGKEKTFTIGNYPTVSLKDARISRFEAQKLLTQNIDPSADKQRKVQELKKLQDGTFQATANRWFKNQLPKWSNKYALKVDQTLTNWVYPKLNHIPIANITSSDLLHILRAMENSGIGETTRKVKGFLVKIFTHAIAEGQINNNPATGLEHALKALPKVDHQRALPVNMIGEFLHKISNDTGHPIVHLGLLLLLHTNVRTIDIRRAEWHDFNFKTKTWTIPATKAKTNIEHKTPLSDGAICNLNELKKHTGHQSFIVKSPNNIEKPFSENAFLDLIKRIGMTRYTTTHGLRTTASTYLYELGHRGIAIEKQLSHEETNQVTKAYNRAEYWDERKKMVHDWANYIEKERDLYRNTLKNVPVSEDTKLSI